MLFMNEWDVEQAANRYAEHPVLGPACLSLVSLVGWTNTHSDGWAYWPKPCRAAKQLQQFIQGESPQARFDTERADATPEAYAAALRPIKAFRTRQGADFPLVSVDLERI